MKTRNLIIALSTMGVVTAGSVAMATYSVVRANEIEKAQGPQGQPGVNGADGKTPYIGANGNWWIGNEDSGIKAEGPAGSDGNTPYIGENGNWIIGGVDTGISANTISIVSVEKTSSNGNVDTYTIYYSDGNTTVFYVTNGKDGAQGIQGQPGADGHSPVVNVGSNGNWYIDGEDTGFRAVGVDGQTPYIGSNGHWFINGEDTGIPSTGEAGKNGITPHIGENGNWWIGDKDTGVQAQGPQGEPGKDGEDGKDGQDGQTPHIGENGNWWIGDNDTGVPATGSAGEDGKDGQNGSDGQDGQTPHIGDNGNWWIGNEDTGVPATGPSGEDGKDGQDGQTPHIGENGNWWIGDQDTGIHAQGDPGQDGQNGSDGKDAPVITSIEKTSSEGRVDTYTVSLSDGTSYTFEVTNGENGIDGKDGVSITSVEKTKTEGNVDTYTIHFSDGSESTFEIRNGTDGKTPVVTIGENGNWFVNGEDTNISAYGKQGSSVLTGQSDPTDDMGNENDVFINSTTWDVFTKSSGTWVKIGNISGADGADGIDGENGLSAYELYKKYHPDYRGTEDEWIRDLANGQLGSIHITVDTAGGTEMDDVTTKPGHYIELEEPTKNGFDFVGWSLNGSLIDINTYVFFSDCTLTAVWKEADSLTVTLDAAGGLVVPGSSIILEYGKPYTLPTPSKSYQTFKGWYYNETYIPLSGTWDYTHENVTLKAVWEGNDVTINLSVNSNYGSLDTTVTTVKVGDSFTLPIPYLKDTSKTFYGWFLGDEQITDRNGKSLDVCTFSGETTLTAKFYEEINTIYDWLSLTGQVLNSDYVVTSDLDFQGLTIDALDELIGTIDGGGHTIKNLKLGEDFLIKSLNGSKAMIKNLKFDGVEASNEGKDSAIVGEVNKGSLENVSITNCLNKSKGVLLDEIDMRMGETGNVYITNAYIDNSGLQASTYIANSIDANRTGEEAQVSINNVVLDEYENMNDKSYLVGSTDTNSNSSVSFYNLRVNTNLTYLFDSVYNQSTKAPDSAEFCIKRLELNSDCKAILRENKESYSARACPLYFTDFLINGELEAYLVESYYSIDNISYVIDTKNAPTVMYASSMNSILFLSKDSDGNITYISPSGVTSQTNAYSLFTKEFFIDYLGFDETIWNFDDINIAEGIYPALRF